MEAASTTGSSADGAQLLEAPSGRRHLPLYHRGFWPCFFFGLFTLGLYWTYYNHRVFREVDHAEGRRHLVEVYWLAILCYALAGVLLKLKVGGPNGLGHADLMWGLFAASLALSACYYAVEVHWLNKARARLGLPRALPPWVLPLFTLAGLGGQFLGGNPLLPWLAGQVLGGLGIVSAGFAFFTYWVLQDRLNEYWAGRSDADGRVLPLGADRAAAGLPA